MPPPADPARSSRRALGRGPGSTRPPGDAGAGSWGPAGPLPGDPEAAPEAAAEPDTETYAPEPVAEALITPERVPDAGAPVAPERVSDVEAPVAPERAPVTPESVPGPVAGSVPVTEPLAEAPEPDDTPVALDASLAPPAHGPGHAATKVLPTPHSAPGGLFGDVLDETAAPPGAAPAVPAPVGPPSGGQEPDQPDQPDQPAEPEPDDGRFKVRLANFEGPFDLLLQLIAKHKLDVTEVALSKVTDEFMTYIRAMGNDWDLDQTTEFLVVAATLLDLKAARLLPSAEVEDEADLALLEARDLLFARLLQYRAYKQIAEIFSVRLDAEARRYPRTVGLEAHHAELLPDVVISIGPEGFARLAVKAMQPKPRPQVYVDHIHAPLVSVREQGEIVVALLKERGQISFRELADDAADTLTVVARFLALLELYRDKAVVLDQEDALGELLVTWTGGDAEATVTDEFDRAPEIPEEKA
ncbi:segregation and condensation protein A [Streptomyces sp. NBC_00306]|uniref:segregation and condensation protein A n=1 Tax=Streptomyces sp. NBC_00306 TaxID=2975708 RepID=UPI002E2E6722|nr:segregation/condensation protein A [Streptomyces sp. NBC_00306]